MSDPVTITKEFKPLPETMRDPEPKLIVRWPGESEESYLDRQRIREETIRQQRLRDKEENNVGKL